MWVEVPASRKVVIEGKPPRFVGGKDIILAIIASVYLYFTG